MLRQLKFQDVDSKGIWPKLLKDPQAVATVHAEMAYQASKDPEFGKPLEEIGFLVADGVGLVLGLRLLGQRVRRCSGIETFSNFVKSYPKAPTFLWGAKEETLSKAVEKLTRQGLNIVGFQDGYAGNEDEIMAKIESSGAEVVFVGMGGSPRQLRLVEKIHRELGIIAMTVGGHLMLSGKATKRPL